jgi:hypothetical protein
LAQTEQDGGFLVMSLFESYCYNKEKGKRKKVVILGLL